MPRQLHGRAAADRLGHAVADDEAPVLRRPRRQRRRLGVGEARLLEERRDDGVDRERLRALVALKRAAAEPVVLAVPEGHELAPQHVLVRRLHVQKFQEPVHGAVVGRQAQLPQDPREHGSA